MTRVFGKTVTFSWNYCVYLPRSLDADKEPKSCDSLMFVDNKKTSARVTTYHRFFFSIFLIHDPNIFQDDKIFVFIT